jgi:D-arabinan exo alpha-(1,3)/(1,5)-arabinofuranosidase (non-reducing end)
MTQFNGLGMSLGNLSRLSHAKSRSLSAENFTGEKGKGAMATDGINKSCARDLGVGWKISPAVKIGAGKTFYMANIEGSGAIQQMWLTPTGNWRFCILRIYWDDEETPSVECPLVDFFAAGWGYQFNQVTSLPVCVNPQTGFNCYWEMPFRKKCVMTITNISDEDMVLYYQINYTLTDVPDDVAYFHAQFRRTNPLPYKDVYTIVDGIKGQGHYVGTYLAWGVHNTGWWGEGEIKFYMDGDKEWPTICGTGTEDYFGGSYCFVNPQTKKFQEYCTPFAGMPQIVRPDGEFMSQMRYALYRWHIMDPIRFETDLRVTIQALSWRYGGRYLPLQDDIASVAFWYQTHPHAPFPKFPDRDALEIN